jgi:glycerol-3-phosphate acyltransferase PlsY
VILLVPYLFGSVPTAYLVVRWSRGIDIRKYGSGNVGASNVWRLTSKPLAIVVIIFDLAKGMVMVWIAQWVGLSLTGQVAVGLAAIVGHNWPVFLRFNGGRGVLTALGVALVLPVINNLVPWGVIIGLAIAAIGSLVLHNSPLGVGLGIAALPLVSWGVDEPLPLTLGFLAMLLITVFRRLTVPRTSVTASVPRGQLFINRLLLDRDIRDREAWIRQALPEVSQQQNKESSGKGNISK